MTWALVALDLLLVLLLAALVAWRPWGARRLASHPRPAASYDEAAQRVAALQDEEREGYHPACLTQLLTHGAKTPRAIVLVHGYTRCPQQFLPLGRLFFDRGHNVLIARLPRHGRADRLTAEHGGLLAAELADYADEVVDIGQGLGEQVTLAGLSAGGVTTAWAAQTRADLDRAVIIAPAFGFRQIPARLTVPLANAALLLPDAFDWWEPELRENSGPPYTYPRRSRRALSNVLGLGFAVQALAARHPPAARSIVLVTNAHDDMVDNAAAERLAQTWRARGARDICQYEFPTALGLPHDLIDPAAPEGKTELVYPKLLELMDGAAG